MKLLMNQNGDIINITGLSMFYILDPLNLRGDEKSHITEEYGIKFNYLGGFEDDVFQNDSVDEVIEKYGTEYFVEDVITAMKEWTKQ